MTVIESDEAQTLPGWNDGPLLHYRVLPRTGQWGELELEQVTANLGAPSLTPVSASQGTGSFAFRQATFDALPTMVHVVNALAAVELGDVLDAGTAHFTGWGDGADMRIVCDWPTSPAQAVALPR